MLVNLSDDPWTCDGVPDEVLLSWSDGVTVDAGRIDVPPRSAVVLA